MPPLKPNSFDGIGRQIVEILNTMGIQASYDYPGFVAVGNYAFGADEGRWTWNTVDDEGERAGYFNLRDRANPEEVAKAIVQITEQHSLFASKEASMSDLRTAALTAADQFEIRCNAARIKKAALEVLAAHDKPTYKYRILGIAPEVPEGHEFWSQIPDLENRSELWEEVCPYTIPRIGSVQVENLGIDAQHVAEMNRRGEVRNSDPGFRTAALTLIARHLKSAGDPNLYFHKGSSFWQLPPKAQSLVISTIEALKDSEGMEDILICPECEHPVSAHEAQYGCEVEGGDNYETGYAPSASGPCGCTAANGEGSNVADAIQAYVQQNTQIPPQLLSYVARGIMRATGWESEIDQRHTSADLEEDYLNQIAASKTAAPGDEPNPEQRPEQPNEPQVGRTEPATDNPAAAEPVAPEEAPEPDEEDTTESDVRAEVEEEIDDPDTRLAVMEFLKAEDYLGAHGFTIEEGYWNWTEGVHMARITFGGGKEYVVAANNEQVVELAEAMVKQQLEDEPSMFNQSMLESYININNLKDTLKDDVEEQVRQDAEAYGWSPAKMLDEEDEDGVQLSLDAESEPSDDWISEKAMEILRDPIQYLKDIYDPDDAMKNAMKWGGINTKEAATDFVAADGAGHFLSSYDGNLHDLPGGGVWWRQN